MEIVTDKEKKVLGVLYKKGPLPISQVARESFQNRTALYYTMEQLQKKGLVETVVTNGTTFFKAIPINEYRKWAQQQLTLLVGQTAELEDWIEGQKISAPTLQSDIRYFEGTEGIKKVYEDTWRNNEDKEIYAITDYDKAYKTLNTYLEKEYFPERIKRGVHVKSILSKKSSSGKIDKSREKQLLREMKFIDIIKDLGIEINIYGSQVSVVAFDSKKPSGVIIKNKLIADAFKKIFHYIWMK